MLLFWSLFLPLGARWSLDARRRRERHEPEPHASVFSAGTVAILLQFVFVYLAAGIVKSTPPWRDGTAVQLFLGNETLGRPLGIALRAHPAWTTAITYVTPVFEILGTLLLFLPWRTATVRMLLLPCFWLFPNKSPSRVRLARPLTQRRFQQKFLSSPCPRYRSFPACRVHS